MNCAKCGKALVQNEKSCSQCGKKLEPNQEKNQAKGPSKDATKTAIIISNIASGLMLFPSFFAILMSPMIFDAPGSSSDPLAILLLLLVLICPIILIGSIIGSWTFFKSEKYKLALFVGGIPLIIIFVYFAFTTISNIPSNIRDVKYILNEINN